MSTENSAANFSGEMRIGNRVLGPGHPVLVVAELSANHNQSFDEAVRVVHAAHQAGADAIKLQTYTADTITIRSDRPEFRIGGGTLWDGRTMHDLYAEAFTPWEWQPKLKQLGEELGMICFSSAFDPTAVDFLEDIGVGVHKIASFELNDIPLIQKMARTGKPLILSTGMASEAEIEEAVAAARSAGTTELMVLKCTSAYPSPPEAMHLRTIPEFARRFGTLVGLSDHTMGVIAPVVAVSLGAGLIEKHMTISRAAQGPDSAFSLEPEEFAAMVQGVRVAERALGEVRYGADEDKGSRKFRRSLYVVKAMRAGEEFTEENVRSIRPSDGMHPRYFAEVLGKCAARDIPQAEPLSWELIAGSTQS